LRIPQDCRPRGKISVVEAIQYFRFLKVPQDCQQRGKFELLKPPKRQCLKIPQDCRLRGRIEVIEATKYLAMFDSTTRLPATGENLN
jgi:hypothetical protein